MIDTTQLQNLINDYNELQRQHTELKDFFKLVLAAAGGKLPIRFIDKMTDVQRSYLKNDVKIMFGSEVSLVHDVGGYVELSENELNILFGN